MRSARLTSERVILEGPGLAEHLVAALQHAAHLDRIGAIDHEVELRSPMTVDAVRNRFETRLYSSGFTIVAR